MSATECRVCGAPIVQPSRRGRARIYCSRKCKDHGPAIAAAVAAAAKAPAEVAPEPPPLEVGIGLAGSVLAELEKAGVRDTFSGQLALALASRVTATNESGISSLSKELRTVMAAALAGAPPGPGGPSDDGPEDEVTQLRRSRERKSGAATG